MGDKKNKDIFLTRDPTKIEEDIKEAFDTWLEDNPDFITWFKSDEAKDDNFLYHSEFPELFDILSNGRYEAKVPLKEETEVNTEKIKRELVDELSKTRRKNESKRN